MARKRKSKFTHVKKNKRQKVTTENVKSDKLPTLIPTTTVVAVTTEFVFTSSQSSSTFETECSQGTSSQENASTENTQEGAHVTQSIGCLDPGNNCEVIDVDKLPDRPDSPVTEDDLMVTHSTSTSFHLVDLTSESPVHHSSLADEAFIERGHPSPSTSSSVSDTLEPSDNEDLPDVSGFIASEKKKSDSADKSDGIVCPICMEDQKQILASGKHLTSTTCGHVFCEECARKSVIAQHKCPTCRKKLNLKQLHPIFL